MTHAFTDVTDDVALVFVHHNGAKGAKRLPETMVGGCSTIDIDGDGDSDIVLTRGREWEKPRAGRSSVAVFRNEGGRFRDVTGELGIHTGHYAGGIASGDVDGDGDEDLFVAGLRGHALLLNDTPFVDHTREAGLEVKDSWTTSAVFLDVENDGDLDLFVTAYIQWSELLEASQGFELAGVGRAYGPPTDFAGAHSYLFINDGTGVFSEEAGPRGLRIEHPTTGMPVAKGLGVVVLDINLDGFPDLFVANDTVQNQLFVNDGSGHFREEGVAIGVAYDRKGRATGAMGVDASFFRDDSTMGIVVGNFANEMSSFYRRLPQDGVFRDDTLAAGFGAGTRTLLTFGVLFSDVNLDGWPDIVQSNGHLEERIAEVQGAQSYAQRLQLFLNQKGRFTEVLETGDFRTPIVGRAICAADIDLDGDPDFVVTQPGRATRVYRNENGTERRSLTLSFDSRTLPSPDIGALVEITAGPHRMKRYLTRARGYQSDQGQLYRFGIGDEDSAAVQVRWRDGSTQKIARLVAQNRPVVVRHEPK